MKDIIEFLKGLPIWAWIIIGTVLFILLILALTNKKIKKLVFKLVLDAEKRITGEKQGEYKYKVVVEQIHAVLPKFLQVFLTQSHINYIIKKAVEKMKKELEEPD